MTNHYFADADILLPTEQDAETQLRIIEENPANLPIPKPGQPLRLAVLSAQKWAPGRTLRIRFLDGDPEWHAHVIESASVWLQYANLKFDFGDHCESDMRITFTKPICCSYIGAYALGIAQDRPTMILGGLLTMPRIDWSGFVLHEFGHAIGCIHEHQIPQAGIHWNYAAVYDYCARKYAWTKQQVDDNIFHVYDRDISNHKDGYDPQSIMIYHIPKEWTTDGYEVPRTTCLSQRDKEFIAEVYPGLISPPASTVSTMPRT